MTHSSRRLRLTALLACTLVAGCGPSAPVESVTVRLYTSVTQDTVDAVLAELGRQRPQARVDVFRAPTGELDARIAAERRSGGVRADVIWATDPLSIQRYAADGLLAPLDEPTIAAVPEAYRAVDFVGTRLLNLVIVTRTGMDPAPTSWADLADIAYRGRVAIPDPSFAGSAFAALGFFADAEGYGLDYYRRLRDNGAVEVQAIGDVISGVAEGRYDAGIALDKPVRDAIAKGSPIELAWPTDGAIAVFSPIAVFASAGQPQAAGDLVDFIISADGQQAIAATGWQPVRPELDWPDYGPVVIADWANVFGRQQQLLDEYRAIFGD